MSYKINSILLFVFLLACTTVFAADPAPENKSWAMYGFERPDGVNPVISPVLTSAFYCPMHQAAVPWENSDTFNPAAVYFNGGVALLYRAEDNTAQGIGSRTSRIGYAYSEDGIHFLRHPAPVLYPGGDDYTWLDNPGGCEDPRVCVTEDGLYVMTYTSFNRKVARLCIATSRDLVHWTKHGPAFSEEKDMENEWSKSGSIVTELKGGRLVISKVQGHYMMYWGEAFVNIATSDDLIHWKTMRDDNGQLLQVMQTRKGFFDSQLTECGPPALKTENGIILFYNGKNMSGSEGDAEFASGAYCAGQALFSLENPAQLLDRTDKPFYFPEDSFEKSGQYPDGTVFIEGLVYKDGYWYLYYGCADSFVGMAIRRGTELQ